MLGALLFAHADVAAAVTAVAALFFVHRRDRARTRAQRGEFFARCLYLFETYRVTQDDLAYPVMSAKYRGYAVRLEPFVDDIAWRKIPSLWLKVTVLTPNPCRGVFDFLVRPRGVEFYSPSSDLAHTLRVPQNWPQDSLLRTDDPEGMPAIEDISPHMSHFADPQMKELLITPRGTRLVCQIWQAERAHYLVLRQARFAGRSVEPGHLKSLLDCAIEISGSLAASEPQLRVA
jgi:hypothetical protein